MICIAFDAEGNAIPFKARNYYAILRDYDNSGNNVRVTYLDVNSKPVNNAYGYATILRQFSDKGLIKNERYLDEEGHPICSGVFGFVKSNEYDESGKLVRQTFLNDRNEPVITELGYASVSYSYYESDGPEYGNVETEFYYDTEGEPIHLMGGQYGLHKEYDECGRVTVITYLDSKGAPIIIDKGYATIELAYNNDNSIYSERYFDELGHPIRLSGGQYGIKNEHGYVEYLDSKGKVQFNIMRTLLNQQYIVVLVAIVLVFLPMRAGKKSTVFFLIVYCGFALFATLMFREVGASRMNTEVFWTYKRFFSSKDARSDVLNNIWLYIPIGAVLFKLHPKRVILLFPIVFSLTTEAVQFVSGTGLCEIDDLINNSFGAILGYETARISSSIRCYTALQRRSKSISVLK